EIVHLRTQGVYSVQRSNQAVHPFASVQEVYQRTSQNTGNQRPAEVGHDFPQHRNLANRSLLDQLTDNTAQHHTGAQRQDLCRSANALSKRQIVWIQEKDLSSLYKRDIGLSDNADNILGRGKENVAQGGYQGRQHTRNNSFLQPCEQFLIFLP